MSSISLAQKPQFRESREDLANRFWPKVNRDGAVVRADLGQCWEWTASLRDFGYGQFMCRRVDGSKRPERAHRVAWFITHGEEPALYVLHRCDNPKCVRPEHLFLGTSRDNVRDMMKKRRESFNGLACHDEAKRIAALPRGDAHFFRIHRERVRGENNGHAKLTDHAVREIRAERQRGTKLRPLADRYGVSINVVSKVARGQAWRHIT